MVAGTQFALFLQRTKCRRSKKGQIAATIFR